MTDEIYNVEGIEKPDTFWLDLQHDLAKDSVRSLEETAKQIISISSLLQTIYFSAITFSDLRTAFAVHDIISWLIVLLFISPIVLWLISLSFAVLVFKPEHYKTHFNSTILAYSTYLEIVTYKSRKLRSAHWALVLGFVPLIISLVFYLVWIH